MHYTARTKPFPHQSRATIAAVRQRNHALFMEPRLGKTKAAIDWACVLSMKGEVSRVLVLAPRIALSVWQSELHKHHTFAYHAETFTHEWGDPLREGGTIDGGAIQWLLAGREETFRATRENGKLARPKQQLIEQWRPDAIIIDESHEYKRPGARGAQDAWRLVQRLRKIHTQGRPYVLLLTGTPSAKGWRDLFAQFRILDPSIFGTNVSHFDERYCIYGQGPRKYSVIRYRNINELMAIVGDHSSSCTAQEAGLAGRVSFNIIPFDLPPKIREAYDDLSENFVTELDGQLITAANVGVKRMRLLQITGGRTTDGRRLHDEKLRAFTDWLRVLWGEGEDCLAFARHTAEVDAIHEAAKELGFRTSIIDGRVTGGVRVDVLRSFSKRRGDIPRCLCIQVQAASMSIDLSWAAEVVFYSLPDGWVTFWQNLNRVRGPKQKRPVRITAICGTNTVDKSVLYGLRRKEDVHRLLLKDPKRFLRGDY